MSANKSATSPSYQRIGSDMAKVDAYANTLADYDEIPELTDEMLARGVLHRNGKPVRGRPVTGNAKRPVSLRLSKEVLDYYRALGVGWQTRLNADLEEIVAKSHPAE